MRPTSPSRHSAPRREHPFLRSLSVLACCLGLAVVSLAATGGSRSSDVGEAVVKAAAEQLGDTYTWGGSGPDTWDCSGLTSTLWREVGGVKDIPRVSRQQHAWAVPLPAEQAEPGDLVFFGDPVSHVALVEKRTTHNNGTTVTMLDASSSRNGVIRRNAWSSGVVRYGRVPRKGMTPVRPWAAPSATPSPTPTATQTATANARPNPQSQPKPSAKPQPTPQSSPPATTASTPQGSKGVPARLPKTQRTPSSPVALKAVKLAQAAVGNTTLTDVALVGNVWRRAGGATLPSSRNGLNAAAHRVPLSDARAGDLIVYAAPGAHVGVYVGGTLMVDASRSLGKVVLRQVWDAPGVQVLRLTR